MFSRARGLLQAVFAQDLLERATLVQAQTAFLVQGHSYMFVRGRDVRVSSRAGCEANPGGHLGGPQKAASTSRVSLSLLDDSLCPGRRNE